MGFLAKPADERRGKPSSSGMERYSLCLGSFQLEQKTPAELRLGSSQYSLHGTKVAELVERLLNAKPTCASEHDRNFADVEAAVIEPDTTLRQQVVDDAMEMVRKTFSVVNEIGAFDPFDNGTLYLCENRLWSYDGSYSGKPDVLVVNSLSKTLIVIDHKSGWIKVPDAQNNHQIRANIALAVDKLNAATWTCIGAVIQPNLGKVGCNNHAWSTTTKETPSDLVNQYRLLASEVVDPANASNLKWSEKACRYCPARPNCDVVKNLFADVATLKMKPSNYQEALELCAVCKMVISDYESGAKAALEKDPTCVPGWALKPGNTVTKITKPALAFDAVKHAVSPSEFMACCTVALGKLTDAFAKGTGIKKSIARDELMSRIEPFTETKQNQPSLKPADLVPSQTEE